MKTVTQAEFEAFVAANAKGEPATEKDAEYGYETFHDIDGNEIAFAAYNAHKPATYHIRDACDDMDE